MTTQGFLAAVALALAAYGLGRQHGAVWAAKVIKTMDGKEQR
jgi:hypothetical protein